MSFQFLEIITEQLHEYTLYEDGNVLREHPCVASTTTLAFSFPNARLLCFRFASTELQLTLTVPPSLETLSVVAKRLVLSCKSTAPLALHHLSLYGWERLDISSLRLASTRVAYLDGPANDQESFSWTELLDIIAPTVEVLIVRHGVPIKKVEAEWGRLLSLGIVVPPWDRDARANSWSTGYGKDDEAMYAKVRDRERLLKAFFKPPSICAPNLQFLFFPSCKACNAPALAALRQDYPTLALYCVVDCSFYWERKGKTVSNGPLEHVRGEKSGVWDEEVWEMRPKKGREKMHSVNRKLVEGYSAEEDQVHVLQCQ
ncbi:unnamed protein product [Closterium sp. NIES-65]|nr:unnamed protein product [Closterium sp. NIES-65]